MFTSMKKPLSAIIAATLCLSTAVPLFAQKPRAVISKTAASETRLFSSTEAFSEGRGVWLDWQTGDETGILGFRLYRLTDGEKQAVSPGMFPGKNLSAIAAGGASRNYNFFDARGGLDTVYLVEAVAADGSVKSSGKFVPRFVADLREIAGEEGDVLMRRAVEPLNANTRSEKLELPPDFDFEIQSRSAENEPSAHETQKWIAAQPGAKISVRNEGLYRVARAELQAAGFDVNAPTANWQLYADGVEQAINIGPNGDYIEFYGKGVKLTETDTRVYYLIAGTSAGRRFGTTVLRGVAGRVAASNFRQTTVYRDYFNYTNSILNGSKSNHFGRLVTTAGDATTFQLNAVDFSAPTARVEVDVQGFTITPHQIRVVLNNVEIGTLTGANRDLMTGAFEVPTANLIEGQNSLKLFSHDVSSNSFAEDIRITFNRKYTAADDRLSFYTTNYRQTRVQNFTSAAIRVLDMTESANPKFVDNLRIEPNGNNFDLVLPSSRGRVLYAAADAGLLTPLAVTANTPSTLSTAANSGEMIIISYKDWLTEAEAWATYRRNDGLSVKVVDVEDIHDEFDFGMPTAESIRSFLSYAKNNWQTAPNYVLLLGDATYDPRNHLGTGRNNLLPAMLVDTTYMETGSDEALADFNGDGLAELGIGRIPIRSGAAATAMLAKVVAFEQGIAQAPARGAVCYSDLPNGYNFEQVCSELWQHLPESMPKFLINRSAPDARTQVLNAINSGRFLINYAGHGSIAAWDGNILHRNDVANFTNTNNNLIIANMLTCLNGYYIQLLGDGLSEAMIKKNQGGAIVSWASSGLTTPDIQAIMATRFYQQLNTGSMVRMGDFVRDAKTTIAGGLDVRLSWVLLGDPTLKIKAPVQN